MSVNLGVIGFGRFGKLMVRYLSNDFKVMVYDKNDLFEDIQSAGAIQALLEDVCMQDIVIISVPISDLKNLLRQIAPLLKQNSLVVDVCSVKEYPIRWMQDLLPKNVSILGTHPVFGPDSAGETLKSRKIALCKERINSRRYEKITRYLRSKGLILIETTPSEHDKQIAVSLCLTHFIGRSLQRFGASQLDMDSEGYNRLLHILGVIQNDTWQLFFDMNRYNPYATEKRSDFMEAMENINLELDTR